MWAAACASGLLTGCGGPQTVSATGAMTALLNKDLAQPPAQTRALADEQALASGDLRIEFLDYDWNLNSVPR